MRTPSPLSTIPPPRENHSSSHPSGRFGDQHRVLAAFFGVAAEIDRAVNAPNYRQAKREQRFLGAAQPLDRPDDVKGQASEVGERPEDRHHHVLEPVELVMLPESD